MFLAGDHPDDERGKHSFIVESIQREQAGTGATGKVRKVHTRRAIAAAGPDVRLHHVERQRKRHHTEVEEPSAVSCAHERPGQIHIGVRRRYAGEGVEAPVGVRVADGRTAVIEIEAKCGNGCRCQTLE